jgi:hypothetical protein
MAYEDLLKDNSVAIENGNYFNLTLTDLNPNTSYPIQLRWKYKDGTFSEWSAVKRLNSVTVPAAPSQIPSTPTVKPIVGAIELAWNGKTSTGADQPYGFNSAKVYVGTTSNFTPVDTGSTKNLVDILDFANGQNTLNIGVDTVVNSSLTLTYGTDYYVKIKTTNGNTAEDSSAVSATGNPVRIGQISNDGLVEVKADKITTGTLQSSSTITVGSSSGKHVIIRGTGNPLSIYGSGGLAGGAILDFDGSGNLSIKGTINATAGEFTGAISIIGTYGTMKLGIGVSSGNDGIYIGANNYWYNTGYFKVGDGTNSVSWNGTTLAVTGQITSTSGTIGGWSIGTDTLSATGLTLTSATSAYASAASIKYGSDKFATVYEPTGASFLIYNIYRSRNGIAIKDDTNIVTVGPLFTGETGSTKSVRNISASTSDPSGGNDGDMWAKYV